MKNKKGIIFLLIGIVLVLSVVLWFFLSTTKAPEQVLPAETPGAVEPLEDGADDVYEN